MNRKQSHLVSAQLGQPEIALLLRTGLVFSLTNMKAYQVLT